MDPRMSALCSATNLAMAGLLSAAPPIVVTKVLAIEVCSSTGRRVAYSNALSTLLVLALAVMRPAAA